MQVRESGKKKPASGGSLVVCRKTSGHEHGDEGQQENQQGAGSRNHIVNVLDHGLDRVFRCRGIVVSRHENLK
jgi:hypothetical protein